MKVNFQRVRKVAGDTTGYFIAWLVGIPVPVLVLVYLIRGH